MRDHDLDHDLDPVLERPAVTIFLSGPMGAGKTTLARAFAAPPLGLRVADLDEAIEHREGASVAELFRTRGEAAFREVERAVAMSLAAGENDVVALGGGTVTDRTTRRALLRAGTLVTLHAPLEVLLARVGTGQTRPLLGDAGADRRAALARILEARADAYAECHATLDTAGRDTPALVAEILALAARSPLVMPLGARTYPILIGPIVHARDEIARRSRPSRLLVVSDAHVTSHAARVRETFATLGVPATEVVLAPGETYKTLASVEQIWNAALAAKLDRDALVLAVGGGVVGDLAGFAAATLLRGVAFAQIPTTLLAMVDASVGGKTGFDRPEGKNLIGAFHQPRLVACDLDVLGTLPDRAYRSGLAEVVKAAWLTGEADVAALERDAAALGARSPDAMEGAVRRAIATKIEIVAEDEQERGRRAFLNLGHTLGHAIEAASGYARTHGECVALGMIAALRIGVALGDATRNDLARMTSLLVALGLPTDLDAALAAPALEGFLASDKKREASTVRFVVPGAPGAVRLEKLAPSRILALARG